ASATTTCSSTNAGDGPWVSTASSRESEGRGSVPELLARTSASQLLIPSPFAVPDRGPCHNSRGFAQDRQDRIPAQPAFRVGSPSLVVPHEGAQFHVIRSCEANLGRFLPRKVDCDPIAEIIRAKSEI